MSLRLAQAWVRALVLAVRRAEAAMLRVVGLFDDPPCPTNNTTWTRAHRNLHSILRIAKDAAWGLAVKDGTRS